MRLTVPTSHLLEAVGHAAVIASTKTTKPILECAFLRADSSTGLQVSASDLDISLRAHVDDAQVETGGVAAIPCTRLLAILREIEEEVTTLSTVDEGVEIVSRTGHFVVRTESVDDIPQIPGFPETSSFSLDVGRFREMVHRTSFATAKEAGRFAFHGVQIRVDPKSITFCATDGRRLARVSQQVDEAGPNSPVTFIVGPRGLNLLDRVLGSGVHDRLELALNERLLLARSGGVQVASRLIEGTFPDTESVIPKAEGSIASLPAGVLAAGLRRASLLATREAQSVEVLLAPEELLIRSRAREVGQAHIELPVQYEGAPLRVGLNPIYLQEALKVMDPAATVTMHLRDARAPVRISDREDFVYVLSPVSLE